MAIDNDKIKSFTLRKIEFLSSVVDCEHSWIEMNRFPSSVEPICRIQYKCTACGVVVVDSIPWTTNDHLQYMREKHGNEKG